MKRIEGVTSVENQIEVLPVSPNDQRIRMAVYRAIFSNRRSSAMNSAPSRPFTSL